MSLNNQTAALDLFLIRLPPFVSEGGVVVRPDFLFSSAYKWTLVSIHQHKHNSAVPASLSRPAAFFPRRISFILPLTSPPPRSPFGRIMSGCNQFPGSGSDTAPPSPLRDEGGAGFYYCLVISCPLSDGERAGSEVGGWPEEGVKDTLMAAEVFF